MAAHDHTAQIKQAAALIKSGNRQQAYQILRQVLTSHPDDWRAWWGLAHASANPQERYTALQKTVRLNPNHEQAQKLLRQVKPGQKATHPPRPGPRQPAPMAVAGPPASPTTPQTRASEAEPWENPFAAEAPGASPFDEPAPWDNPFADQPASSSPFDKPAPWDAPFADSPPSSRSTAQPRSTTRSGSLPSSTVKARPSSGSDKTLNIAIGVVGVLIMIAIGVLAATSLDFDSIIRGLLYGGAPNNFTGGDPYRTTGGGHITIDGNAVRDSVSGLNDAHNWVFEGRAGQFVRITCQAVDDTDPRIQLLDPDGSRLALDDDSGRDYGLGYWDSYLTFTLPSDGTYTVRVDVFQVGEFMLQVHSW